VLRALEVNENTRKLRSPVGKSNVSRRNYANLELNTKFANLRTSRAINQSQSAA